MATEEGDFIKKEQLVAKIDSDYQEPQQRQAQSALTAQYAQIETTTQNILDVRATCPEAALADLCNPVTMPQDLQRAYRANDKAVASSIRL